jgi:hypothetical protein
MTAKRLIATAHSTWYHRKIFLSCQVVALAVYSQPISHRYFETPPDIVRGLT